MLAAIAIGSLSFSAPTSQVSRRDMLLGVAGAAPLFAPLAAHALNGMDYATDPQKSLENPKVMAKLKADNKKAAALEKKFNGEYTDGAYKQGTYRINIIGSKVCVRGKDTAFGGQRDGTIASDVGNLAWKAEGTLKVDSETIEVDMSKVTRADLAEGKEAVVITPTPTGVSFSKGGVELAKWTKVPGFGVDRFSISVQ